MSGYLDVKSNLTLNPFKSWKRQWCILRPCPTRSGSGTLAVYSSEAGAAAGTVDLPFGSTVRRTKSQTRPYTFAVFTPEDPRRPRVLLAAASHIDVQLWIDKIKALLSENKFLGTDILLKDSHSISIMNTDLSRKCGLNGVEGLLTITTKGLLISQPAPHQTRILFPWTCLKDIGLNDDAMHKHRICTLKVDSEFIHGGGELRVSCPSAPALVREVRRAGAGGEKQLSRSEGDLRCLPTTGEVSRGSWYSGPSDVSLDDTDLVMSKETKLIPNGQLSRCARAGHLAPADKTLDDSAADRRSLVSIASGIYEEIPDIPSIDTNTEVISSVKSKTMDDAVSLQVSGMVAPQLEEPTYESVLECVYATMRRPTKRYPPPPLPPRLPFGISKMGESWSSHMNKPTDANVTRHSSLGSLHRCCITSIDTETLPKPYKPRQTFNVFRKRLKSDSLVTTPPKSDTKENKHADTKKKRFDFTPSKDIFKNFRVSKSLMKNLKISTTNLSKVTETKSCEFLDETEHVTANRCSKSVERLEGVEGLPDFSDADGTDLSIEYREEAEESSSLPPDIVELILHGRDRLAEMRLKQRRLAEDDYMPMSPIVVPQPPIEHHYIVMSPRSNIA